MYQEKVNMEQGIRPINEQFTDRSFLMSQTTKSGKNEQPEIMKNQWRNFIMAFFQSTVGTLQTPDIDMEKEQYSKLISDILEPDIAISMGCNVGCPFIGRPFDDNWGLDDPTGKSDEDFIKVINQIELKIKNMIDRMK